jgi:tight adherence protein B
MQFVILGLVFLGTVLLLVGTFAFINRRRLSASDAARSRLKMVGDAPGAVASILRDQRVSEVASLNQLMVGKSYTEWLSDELARAGSKRRPGEVVMMCAVGAAAGLVLGLRFGGIPIGVAFVVIGAALPIVMLKRQQGARIKKFEEQLPDALEMLVNALKAGYSLQAAMEFVGKEMPAPLGPEFGRFYDEQRLGVDVRTALVAMQERVGTTDIKMFVTSLLIQRETGGNLGEVLGNLAALMRERVAFRGTVATLTAEPKMSARILTGLPIVVFLAITVTQPGFIDPLLNTDTGHMMLAYATISVIVGYIVMMNIAKVDM